MEIRCSKIQILQVFLSLLAYYKKTYCWPTRKTILKLLEKRYKTKISLSALDQHLGELRTAKYIKSFRRWGKREDGTIHNKPSNRQLTWKGVKFLRSLGNKIPGWLSAWLKSGVLPGGRKPPRKPTPPRGTDQDERRSRASAPEPVAGPIKSLLGVLDPEPSKV